MLLAIDTSTQLAGLALYDGSVRAEMAWQAGRKHSVQLLPEIDRLLALIGVERDQLTAIAAARGPGSFTGVRVGLAAAQGLALALGLPAYGVCSLDVLAAGQEASALPVRPLLDAGRNRFATALYQRRDEHLERSGDIVGIELAQLEALVGEPCLLCGDLDAEARERIRAILGERVAFASPAGSLRRPGILAQLGWEQHQAGGDGSRASLEPLYLSR
jgi:tRNA threonylcarbamoyladenosine biosynthesis protein TsaB